MAVFDLFGLGRGPALEPEEREMWYAFLDKVVLAIVMVYNKGPRVKIIVNEEYKASWMDTELFGKEVGMAYMMAYEAGAWIMR
jgi:hypothetical protein